MLSSNNNDITNISSSGVVESSTAKNKKPKKQFVPKELQSLLCVFLALRGTQITIQLRSNCEVYGTIENVDAYLNIELSNATLTNRFIKKDQYELILIQSRNIRFIQIPDKIDLNNLLFIYSKTLAESKKKYQRSMRKAPTVRTTPIQLPTLS